MISENIRLAVSDCDSNRASTGQAMKIKIDTPAQSKVLLTLFAICIEMIIVVVIHPAGILSLFYFLLLTVVAYIFILRHISFVPVSLYALYVALMLSLYFLQYWGYPEYQGFSGGVGIGTDDAFFFDALQRLDNVPRIGTPADGSGAYIRTTFARFLQFITPLPVRHPFDVLFFTAMTTAFIPVLTREVALLLFEDKRAAKLASIIAMFSPFLLAQSLILMRDGLTTILFMGAIYLFLKSRYVGMGILGAFLFYIRIASGLQLTLALAFFVLLRLINLRKISSKIFYVVVIFMTASIITVLLYPMVYTYLEGKHVIVAGNFFRVGYTERVTSEVSDSIFGAIYRQPYLIRVPLGLVYFFLVPNFVPQEIVKQGIFRPRLILENMSALLMIFYLKCFMQAVFSAWRNKNTDLKITILAYVALLFVLSQFSVQFRHKVMFLPVFHIIVAYGYYYRTRLGSQVGRLGALSLAGVQILRTLLRIF